MKRALTIAALAITCAFFAPRAQAADPVAVVDNGTSSIFLYADLLGGLQVRRVRRPEDRREGRRLLDQQRPGRLRRVLRLRHRPDPRSGSEEAQDHMTSKPSNPKDIVGIKKAPMSTVSAPVLAEIGVAMLEGACKYGRHNYRAVGVRASVYYDATMRHLMAWWEGQDIDPDSGMSHITKALASLAVLRDSQIRGNVEDDRPPSSAEFYAELNKKAEAILERAPKQPPKHYTIADLPAPELPEVREHFTHPELFEIKDSYIPSYPVGVVPRLSDLQAMPIAPIAIPRNETA